MAAQLTVTLTRFEALHSAIKRIQENPSELLVRACALAYAPASPSPAEASAADLFLRESVALAAQASLEPWGSLVSPGLDALRSYLQFIPWSPPPRLSPQSGVTAADLLRGSGDDAGVSACPLCVEKTQQECESLILSDW